jgi:hypothetical protein
MRQPVDEVSKIAVPARASRLLLEYNGRGAHT